MKTAKQLKTHYDMTDSEVAELEKSAEAYERGQWPAGKITRTGRPPIYKNDELESVTFRVRKSRLAMVDSAAKQTGESRSDFLREAIEEKLARTAPA